jgi:hypothetical protein
VVLEVGGPRLQVVLRGSASAILGPFLQGPGQSRCFCIEFLLSQEREKTKKKKRIKTTKPLLSNAQVAGAVLHYKNLSFYTFGLSIYWWYLIWWISQVPLPMLP